MRKERNEETDSWTLKLDQISIRLYPCQLNDDFLVLIALYFFIAAVNQVVKTQYKITLAVRLKKPK